MHACEDKAAGTLSIQMATWIEADEYRDIMDQALGTILDAGKILFAEKSHRSVVRSPGQHWTYNPSFTRSLHFGTVFLIPMDTKEAHQPTSSAKVARQ